MNRCCSRHRLREWVLLTTLVLAALVVSGCGDSGPKRYEISGNVTLKGSPIEEGIIQFEPMDKGPTMSGASVLKGKYFIPRDKGLAAGKYRVSLYAGDGTSGEGMAGITATADPKPPKGFRGKGIERVPPEYNTKSTLVREVTASGPNKVTFDFEVP
jgi:hypothetical protein